MQSVVSDHPLSSNHYTAIGSARLLTVCNTLTRRVSLPYLTRRVTMSEL